MEYNQIVNKENYRVKHYQRAGKGRHILLPVVSKSSIRSTCRNGFKTRPSAVLLLAAKTQ